MNGNIETVVARHDEQIKDLEQRVQERRSSEIELFNKLETINANISDLKTDFAGWKGRVAVYGALIVLVISVIVNIAVKHL